MAHVSGLTAQVLVSRPRSQCQASPTQRRLFGHLPRTVKLPDHVDRSASIWAGTKATHSSADSSYLQGLQARPQVTCWRASSSSIATAQLRSRGF